MPIKTANDLFLNEVRDLYDAEKQILRVLPRVAKAAASEELAQAFREHTEETKGQIQRLEQVFEMLGQRPRSRPCKAMKGLIEEAQEVMSEDGEDNLLDCAMVGSGRRVEHYEMAAYQSVQDAAKALGMTDAVRLLGETLEEEKQMDRRLKQISGPLLKAGAKPGMQGQEGRATNGKSTVKTKAASAENRNGGQKRSDSNRSAGTKQSTTSRSGNGAQARSRNGSNGRGSSNGRSNNLTKTTTDHEEIRQWAESRGAHPACVKGTGKKGDTGMIRIDFPGFSGGDSLQEISWDEFFQKFDGNDLALIYQERTAEGEQSNFNKLVRREK